MVDERFIEYFRKWESKGYSEEQIKSFLLKAGNSPNVVEEAATASRSLIPTNSVSTQVPGTLQAPSNPQISSVSSTSSVSSGSARHHSFWVMCGIILAIFAVIAVAYFIVDQNLNFGGLNTFSENVAVSPSLDSTVNPSGTLLDNSVTNPVGTEKPRIRNPNASSCRVVVGLTTAYDDSAATLIIEKGTSTTYSGRTVSVTAIDPEGCTIKVDYVDGHLIVGEIKKVGTVYITLTDLI
jgi:hypothetical protein